MLYYSTNKKSAEVDFKTAVLKGLPGDNGLFMPKQIPELLNELINSLPDLTFQEISLTVFCLMMTAQDLCEFDKIELLLLIAN